MFTVGIIYDYEIVNPIDIIDGVPCPILFIHKELDELIKWDEVNNSYIISGNPSDVIWEVSNTEHSQVYRTHPTEYIEKVDIFLTASSKDK